MMPWEKWGVQLLPGHRSAHSHPTLSKPPECTHQAVSNSRIFSRIPLGLSARPHLGIYLELSPPRVDPTPVHTTVPLGLPSGLCLLSAIPHRAWAGPLPKVCARAQHQGGRLGGGGKGGLAGTTASVGGHPREGPGASQGPAEPLLSPRGGQGEGCLLHLCGAVSQEPTTCAREGV